MRELCTLLTSGLLFVTLAACSDRGGNEERQSETGAASTANGAGATDWFTYEPSPPDQYGAPTQADPEIHEAYVRDLLETGRYDESTTARFEVPDHTALAEALNSRVLLDLDTQVQGHHGSYIQRQELIFDDLSGFTNTELIEICERVSGYLAGMPETAEIVGPVAFVGSHMVESVDEPGFFPVTPVFYNDRLAPGDSGSCTVL